MTSVTVNKEVTNITVEKAGTVVTAIKEIVSVVTVAKQGPMGPPGTGSGEGVIIDLKPEIQNVLDSRIEGVTAGPESQDIYSTRNDSTSTYVRSDTHFLKGLDLTGISAWSSGGKALNGTLISPRHALFANHSGNPNGRTLRFVTNENEVIERTVTTSTRVGTTDIKIGLLDSDLPSSVTFYKVLTKEAYLTTLLYYGEDFYLPSVFQDQNQKLFIGNVATNYFLSQDDIVIYNNNSPVLSPFWKTVQTGDSGHPIFFALENELVLLSAFHYAFPTKSDAISYYSEEINSVMTSLGGGYQLTPPDILTLKTSSVPGKAGHIVLYNHEGLLTADYDTAGTVTSATNSYVLKNSFLRSPDSIKVDVNGFNFYSPNTVGTISGVHFHGNEANWRIGLGLGDMSVLDDLSTFDTDDLTEGAANKYDQTVTLTAGDNVSIDGTYPDFTINAADQGGDPAGADKQVQYNNSGSFGASANFTFDGTRSFKMGDATGLNISDGTGIYSAGYNIGRNNEVANADAFVFGRDNDPTSVFTGAIVGLANSSDITGSTILGQANTINNVPNSTIVGMNNNLSKGTSVIMTATATVVGFQNTVTGGGFVSSQQVVVGNLNTSSSSQACVFGVSLTNSTANSVMLGFSTANVLFTVANGAVFSSGQKVNPDGSVFLPDVAAAPATPTGGGVMYVEAGALKYKGSSGTVTVLGVS